MAHFRFLFLPLTFLLFSACAAHTNLEPTGKGNLDASLSIGGPVVSAFGTKVPVPYAAAGANYGVSDRLDVSGNLHLLPIAYGIVGMDIGATWYPVLNRGFVPTVGIQPGFLVFSSLKSDVGERIKAYPLLSGSLSWHVGRGLVYTGFDAAVPFSSADYDENSPSAIFSPFWGYRWTLGRKTYLLTELKWHAANVRSDMLAVEYLDVNGYGAITTLFSIVRSF